jgi:hypothetical protein
MRRPLTTYVLLTPALASGAPLPPLPPSPPWDALTPAQQATLLDATPLVLEVIPGRTVLLVLDANATADRVETIDFRWRRDPAALDRALALASRLVSRQIDKAEAQHAGQLTPEERQDAREALVPPTAWGILLRFDPTRAPTPSAWMLSRKGPLSNPTRAKVRASSRRQRAAAKRSSPPPARASRAKAVDMDPLVLACRAGMVAHLDAPLALGFLHQGLAPSALASSAAMQRATRRRLEALRQQAKAWARRNGYTATDAARAFPCRCPRYVEPTGATTPAALRALELLHRTAAWSGRASAA